MPVRAANTRILIDQFDFSQQSKGLTLAIAGEALDANTLQSTEHNSLPGLSEATLDLNGYFNGVGAGQLEQELKARLGSETPCVVSVILDTAAALPIPAYVLPSTWGNQLKIDAPLQELLMLTGQWQQAAQRGLLLAHSTFTAPAMGTVIDLGAGTTQPGFAVLHVRSISGVAAGAVFRVLTSDDPGFNTSISKVQFTVSAVGAQYVAIASDVWNRYLAFRCIGLGGATNIACTAIAGISGVTG